MLLKEAFPQGRFGAPASRAAIQRAEVKLGVRFPEALVDLYLECDGFSEPLGNAAYLFSLEDEGTMGSLVSSTTFWWEEWPKTLSDGPDLKPYVFFGSSSADEAWGIRCKPPHDIIAYHHHMGRAVEEVGRDVLQVYLADHRLYDE